MFKIRRLLKSERAILNEFLYEAIFIPDGVDSPPKSIINNDDLQVYVAAFGENENDICFVAEAGGKIVGAAWARIMNDYGHIEDGVPSLAVSLYKEYRGRGIGMVLMQKLLSELENMGHKKVSLAVQKQNYAVRMYRKLGFEVVGEKEEEFLMLKYL